LTDLKLMKRILVIYYTQTGQLRQIAEAVVSGLPDGVSVDYFRIMPDLDFPFPWPSDVFFDAMPESVKELPVSLDMSGFPHNKHYDLVILAAQVWFLSPSIPISSFLQSEEVKVFFQGKRVLTLFGVRNMWVVARDSVKRRLLKMGAEPVGNIVLTDKSGNMISVITIIRWLIHGKKDPTTRLPEAGVAAADIVSASRFGEPMGKALEINRFSSLQKELLRMGAVEVSYHIIKIEKTAVKIFRKFAEFILKKGNAGDPKRIRRVRFFKHYLLFVIFVVFPFASLIFKVRKFFLKKTAKREMEHYLQA
jgi:hypothetical protein